MCAKNYLRIKNMLPLGGNLRTEREDPAGEADLLYCTKHHTLILLTASVTDISVAKVRYYSTFDTLHVGTQHFKKMKGEKREMGEEERGRSRKEAVRVAIYCSYPPQ